MKPAEFRCHTCGYATSSWAAMERHSDQNRHPRIEMDLREVTDGTE